MKLHGNAALSPNGRRRLVSVVLEQGRADLLEVGRPLAQLGR